MTANINRCHLSDNKLLPACFAEQHRGERSSIDCPALLQLFSGFPIQACVKGKYQYMSLQWQKAVASLFCRAARGKRSSTVCSALLQLFGGFPIQACVKGKYQYMSLQWQKAVVSLFCQSSTGAETKPCLSSTAATL